MSSELRALRAVQGAMGFRGGFEGAGQGRQPGGGAGEGSINNDSISPGREGDNTEQSSLGSPQGTFKIQTPRLTPRQSDSIDWGGDRGICIFYSSLGIRCVISIEIHCC